MNHNPQGESTINMNPQAIEFNTIQGQGEKGLMASKWAPAELAEIEQYGGASLFQCIDQYTQMDLRYYMATAKVKHNTEELVKLHERHSASLVELDARTTRNEAEQLSTRKIFGTDMNLVHHKIQELERKMKMQDAVYERYERASRTLPPMQIDTPNERAAKVGESAKKLVSAIGDGPMHSQTLIARKQEIDRKDTPLHNDDDKNRESDIEVGSEIQKPLSDVKANSETKSMAERIKDAHALAAAEAAEAYEGVSEIRKKQVKAKAKNWMPFAVRKMPHMDPFDYGNKETFTWEFLTSTLKGTQISPSFYYNSGEPVLQCKTYWLLEGVNEPCAPKAAGQHGAKITVFFNCIDEDGEPIEEESWTNVPVFIRHEDADEYIYLGNYSQTRYSDKISYDTIMDIIPEHIRHYWADQLCHPDRPAWATEALIEHFWPKPKYEGPMSSDSRIDENGVPALADGEEDDDVTNEVAMFLDQLKVWKRDADMRVAHLTYQNLVDAFERTDIDEEPGLRMWWEYLEFTGFHEAFYNDLVGVKKKAEVEAKKKREEAVLAKKREEAALAKKKELAQAKVEVPRGPKYIPPHLADDARAKWEAEQANYVPPHLSRRG